MEKRKEEYEEDTLYDLADLFRIFGDSTRIKILFYLRGREASVHSIALALNMSQSSISHQLRVLKSAKLVKNRRDGKEVWYSLDDEHVDRILETGMEHIREPKKRRA